MDYKWIQCKECGHKLFKVYEPIGLIDIETKCHSCKTINRIKTFSKKFQKHIDNNIGK